MIGRLQDLRLLPPPFNELVPLLTTIAAFTLASALLDLDKMWSKVTGDIMSYFSWTEQNLAVYGTFALYMATHWGYALCIHVAEHTFPKTLSNFKIQKEDPIASWSEVAKMIPLVLFNQGVFCLPMLTALFSVRPIDMAVPSISKFVGFMLLNVLSIEVWLYTVHRTLHTKFLYKNLHYIHHQYKVPSCLETVYVHPFEFVIAQFSVLLAGPAVSGPPLLVAFAWIVLSSFLQVHDHCGYWFPFLPRVLLHDYHHQKSQCCYGILGLLDSIFKTEGGFREFVKDHENSNPSKVKST